MTSDAGDVYTTGAVFDKNKQYRVVSPTVSMERKSQDAMDSISYVLVVSQFGASLVPLGRETAISTEEMLIELQQAA